MKVYLDERLILDILQKKEIGSVVGLRVALEGAGEFRTSAWKATVSKRGWSDPGDDRLPPFSISDESQIYLTRHSGHYPLAMENSPKLFPG